LEILLRYFKDAWRTQDESAVFMRSTPKERYHFSQENIIKGVFIYYELKKY